MPQNRNIFNNENELQSLIEGIVAKTVENLFVENQRKDRPERIALSVDDVAAELGIAKTSIYKMIKNNEMPHRKIGKRILVSRVALENWLLGN